jgi:DNA repair protein RadD
MIILLYIDYKGGAIIPTVSQVLSRADELIIQELLGEQTVRLLRVLNQSFSYNSSFKELIIELFGEQELLINKKYRNILINLLKSSEANLLSQILGIKQKGLNGDIFSSLNNQTFRRGSKQEESLFYFFKLSPPALNLQQSNIPMIHTQGSYQLFSHQRKAALKVKESLDTYPFRVLLHMPTGSGKTRTAMNIIADLFRSKEPSLVIWLAATEELCQQAVEEFEKAWGLLGNRELPIYRFWGNNSLDPSTIKEGLIVAGLSKIVRTTRNLDGHRVIRQLSKKVSLVVMDEAHQAIAETYKWILDLLVTNDCKLLGLSATPGRTWNDVSEDEKLSQFFYKRKVILDIDGYENPVDYLVDEGYLANVNYRTLMHKNPPSGFLIDNNNMDLSHSFLNRIGKDEERNLIIIQAAERMAAMHKRIIIFAPSVECSDMFAFILKSRGYQAYSLTGTTNSILRRRIIEDYKNEDTGVKILCNYGVLTTGFDAPKTSAAIIGRPTISLVLYSQMIGRAIRGIKAGGNHEADVITIIDQGLPGFDSVSNAFKNWEDVWNG